MPRRLPYVAVVIGVTVETLAFLLLNLDESVAETLGLAGAIGVVIAVVTALFGGAIAGAVTAGLGWTIFFFTVADQALRTIFALPLWVGTGVIVGLVAGRLIAFERERAEMAVADLTAHGVRTPVATIHGIVQALQSDLDLSEETRQHMLDLIAQESRRLLDEELRAREREEHR
jgi:signal transduction histidine kinase